jgi:hypothetical protein
LVALDPLDSFASRILGGGPGIWRLDLPLTPLENRLRQWGGESGYAGGFIEEYALAIIYPQGLTQEIQFVLGAIVVLMTMVTYGLVWWRRASLR